MLHANQLWADYQDHMTSILKAAVESSSSPSPHRLVAKLPWRPSLATLINIHECMNMLRVLLGVQMSKLQVRVNSCLQWANDRVSKTVGAKNRELSCGWLVCYIHSPFLACCQCIAGTHLLKERIWANSGTSKKKNIISGPTPPTNTSCCVALPLKCSALPSHSWQLGFPVPLSPFESSSVIM